MSCNTKTYTFIVNQGADESRLITLVSDSTDLPINITGYTFESEIKFNYSDVNVVTTITCTIVDAIEGKFRISLSAAQTTSMLAGEYVYDIKMTTNSNVISRVLQGQLIVSPEVTS